MGDAAISRTTANRRICLRWRMGDAFREIKEEGRSLYIFVNRTCGASRIHCENARSKKQASRFEFRNGIGIGRMAVAESQMRLNMNAKETSITMHEETDPAIWAEARARRAMFARNVAWLEAHSAEV